jgi:uncharacterized membrane protein
MIMAIIYTLAIFLICRLAVSFLWEVDEQGNVKVNAWLFAGVLTGIVFRILGQVMQ